MVAGFLTRSMSPQRSALPTRAAATPESCRPGSGTILSEIKRIRSGSGVLRYPWPFRQAFRATLTTSTTQHHATKPVFTTSAGASALLSRPLEWEG